MAGLGTREVRGGELAEVPMSRSIVGASRVLFGDEETKIDKLRRVFGPGVGPCANVGHPLATLLVPENAFEPRGLIGHVVSPVLPVLPGSGKSELRPTIVEPISVAMIDLLVGPRTSYLPMHENRDVDAVWASFPSNGVIGVLTPVSQPPPAREPFEIAIVDDGHKPSSEWDSSHLTVLARRKEKAN